MPPTSGVCAQPPIQSVNFNSPLVVRRVLAPEALLCDPEFAAHGGDDQNHWAQQWQSDSEFRISPENRELFYALYALQNFLSGSESTLPEPDAERIRTWFQSARDPNASPMDRTVLNNLRSILSTVRGPGQDRADRILEIIGRPAAAAPDPQTQSTEPEASLAETEETDESEGEAEAETTRSQDSFVMQSISLETHFADAAMRELPSIYTLGVLPAEGLSQFQSSTFALRAGAEVRFGEFSFFGRLYGADARPDGNPEATFGQAGLIVGMVETAQPMLGQRGDGFHLTLGGMNQVGLGLGMGWCAGIDHSEVSGVECDGDSTFQISTFGESDLISLGVGNFELGVRLIPSNAYLNIGAEGLAEFDRDPIAFRMTYYLNPPPRTSGQPILRSEVSDSEMVFTALNMANSYILNNFRRRQEAAFEVSRPLFLGNPGQYTLLNVGSAFNAILSGLDHGGLGYRMHWSLRYGNDAQRIGLGVLMGAEFLANVIGAGATGDIPDNLAVFLGEVPPADAEREAVDLQGGAFRLAWPSNLVRDGLALLGAVGVFGDRNEAIANNDIHFLAAHGVGAVLSLIPILTSGDLSGDGFLGWSIIGNQLPGSGEIALEQSRFSIDSQRSQYLRLEAGMTGLSYFVNGLVDYLVGRISYLEGREAGRSQAAAGESSAGLTDPQLQLHLDANSRGFQVGLSGRM